MFTTFRLFEESKSFRVAEAVAQYHHSTDGYTGERIRIVAFCRTLDSALKARTAHYDLLDEYDEVRYFIIHPKGYTIADFDLTVNSYYNGPVDNSIPF